MKKVKKNIKEEKKYIYATSKFLHIEHNYSKTN